jgi:hypothetical protein
MTTELLSGEAILKDEAMCDADIPSAVIPRIKMLFRRAGRSEATA